MVISGALARQIVVVAQSYLGRPFDWHTFNCVHFVRMVYSDVGLIFPMLQRHLPPPPEFHLSPEGFESMPLGHSVFFKHKKKTPERYWSHVAIIVGPDTLIHCTRHLGGGVTLNTKSEFLSVYTLANVTNSTKGE